MNPSSNWSQIDHIKGAKQHSFEDSIRSEYKAIKQQRVSNVLSTTYIHYQVHSAKRDIDGKVFFDALLLVFV